MDWKHFLNKVRANGGPDGEAHSSGEIYSLQHLAMALGCLIGKASMGDSAAREQLRAWIEHPDTIRVGGEIKYPIGPVRIGPMEIVGSQIHDIGMDKAIADAIGLLTMQYVWELGIYS